MNYVTAVKLMSSAVAPEASEEGVWDEYAEGASRLFDKLCDVEDDFFAKAGQTATAKTFYGNGIDMLQLPPFVGSVTGITIDDEAFDTGDWYVRNGYVVRLDDDEFDEDAVIVVTARWGFAEVPKDVQIVVLELANYLWRMKDSMFAQISGVETPDDLSPTVKATIKKFRDKYSQSYL